MNGTESEGQSKMSGAEKEEQRKMSSAEKEEQRGMSSAEKEEQRGMSGVKKEEQRGKCGAEREKQDKESGCERAHLEELVRLAFAAQKRSYSPYSGFATGAALEAADGRVFLGCNIENAAYSPTNCAERTAFFKAVSEGVRAFRRIAVVGGYPGRPGDYCAPCGVCRQVMAEFCDVDTFEIILARGPRDYKIVRLAELLPLHFGPEDLGAQAAPLSAE